MGDSDNVLLASASFFFFFSLFWLCWVFIATYRFSSRSMWAQLPRGYGILVPQPGIKPASPVLQGRFLTTLTTGPPRKFPASTSERMLEAQICKARDSPSLIVTKHSLDPRIFFFFFSALPTISFSLLRSSLFFISWWFYLFTNKSIHLRGKKENRKWEGTAENQVSL